MILAGEKDSGGATLVVSTVDQAGPTERRIYLKLKEEAQTGVP
jgi:hypothetical protein